MQIGIFYILVTINNPNNKYTMIYILVTTPSIYNGTYHCKDFIDQYILVYVSNYPRESIHNGVYHGNHPM